jgi:hypothetical protein
MIGGPAVDWLGISLIFCAPLIALSITAQILRSFQFEMKARRSAGGFDCFCYFPFTRKPEGLAPNQ